MTIEILDKNSWNKEFKSFKTLLKKPGGNLQEIIDKGISLHAFTHESPDSTGGLTLEDLFWRLEGDPCRTTPKNPYSPAWHLWHSARIEDITCAHLLIQEEEVLDSEDFLSRLNVPVRHTGNSLALSEMQDFNNKINLSQLRKYRKSVSRRTQILFSRLTPDFLKEPVSPEAILRIQERGSVHEEDSWLLDYWGKKKVSGIIEMPLTRHLLVHINSAMRLM